MTALGHVYDWSLVLSAEIELEVEAWFPRLITLFRFLNPRFQHRRLISVTDELGGILPADWPLLSRSLSELARLLVEDWPFGRSLPVLPLVLSL